MTKTKILSMLCAGLFTLLPTGQALMAPLNVQTTKQKTNSSAVLTTTESKKKAEEKN